MYFFLYSHSQTVNLPIFCGYFCYYSTNNLKNLIHGSKVYIDYYSVNQTNKKMIEFVIQLSPVWKIAHEYMIGNLENSWEVNM